MDTELTAGPIQALNQANHHANAKFGAQHPAASSPLQASHKVIYNAIVNSYNFMY